MNRRSLAFLPFALTLLSCAALPWLPAIVSAIETARAMLAKAARWVDDYRGIPGIPISWYSEFDSALKDALATLDQAEKTARKGSEFEREARTLYAAAYKTIVGRVLRLLESMGLGHLEGGNLLLHEPLVSLRADGAGPSETVEMPPTELR